MKVGRIFLGLALVVSQTVVPAVFAQQTKPDETKKDDKGLVECDMEFNLSGWSAFYSTSKGEGTIKCNNGQTAKVKVKSHGGGITFGKSDVIGGTGHFTGAKSIDELFGSYVQSEANAGAGKSASAQALTKGTISLALAGTGRGVNIGFSFGKFDIEKADGSGKK
jgi:hypothetical protein